jgi:hypothetical protein
MAATGYTPISLYYSTTALAQPLAGDLVDGELAINITDGKLYYKDNGGTVQVIAGTGGSGIVAGSNTQIQFNNSGNFGASSNLTWDGTTLSTTGLTASSTVTISGGTANGVGYLNASKVLTTGTALTFDGTNFVNLGGVVRALAAATQDALQLQGRAGGTSSYITTLTPGTLTASNTLTLPVGTTTLAGLGTTQTFSAAQTFSSTVTMSGTTTNIALGTSQTSGTWTAGGAAQTGTITLDQSTKTHTLAIGTGATESGLTKTINIGTGGVATSTTAITIGSTNGTTITLNGTVNATTVNVTTLDLTNLEVTNIKAKDGTAAASIADSTGIITVTTQLNVGNLNLSGNTLSSTDANGNIVLAPNGTGDVQLDADTVRIGDSNANATLTTNGTGDLVLNTNSGTNSGSITIQDGVDGNIVIAPNGNGQVQITNALIDVTTIEVTNIKAKDGTAAITIADSTGVVTVSSQLQVDNINISTNTISSTDTNGNIVLAPNGTGDVQVDADTLRVGDSGAAATITTNGAGNLTLSTNEGTNSGTIVINQGVNGNIEIAPNGTGDVYVTADTLRVGDSNATATITTNGTGDLVINTNGGTNAGSITLANGANGNITIAPNGTGDVYVDADTLRVGDSNAAATITTNGTGNLVLNTNAGTNSGSITINQGSNGNIEVAPNGTGDVYLTADTVRIGDSNANATLTTNGTGDLILNTNAGTNSGSITIADAANGDISLAPNGNGSVVITNTGTSNALRITQTGTGNALLVEDSTNPDSSPFVIDANGNMVNGYTSVITVSSGTPRTQSIGGTPFSGLTYGDNATSGVLQLGKSRGTSAGTHAILQSGDGINQIRFEGSDGTNFIRAAAIGAEVDGTPGTNDMPGRLGFYTTADGASSPTERVRINASGLTTVGYSAATGAALSTSVAAKLYSSNTTYTDGITAASGTVTHGTIVSFDNPAIAATNASVTYTNASTLYIDGAPSAGSNVTITNPYSLYVAAGTVYFGGTVSAADPIVQQSDIGTGANEIPLNQYLGANAYVDTETPALAVGTGITTGTGTICKANGGLSGGIYRMSILIDLTGLNSGGTAGDIIGVNGTALPCYIAQLPNMVVLGGRMTCLETPAGGDTDIDLYSATEGTGVEDQAITALTETQIINAGAQTIGTVTYFAADPAANTYFYFVGQGTANATYTAGRFLIEVFGVQ